MPHLPTPAARRPALTPLLYRRRFRPRAARPASGAVTAPAPAPIPAAPSIVSARQRTSAGPCAIASHPCRSLLCRRHSGCAVYRDPRENLRFAARINGPLTRKANPTTPTMPPRTKPESPCPRPRLKPSAMMPAPTSTEAARIRIAPTTAPMFFLQATMIWSAHCITVISFNNRSSDHISLVNPLACTGVILIVECTRQTTTVAPRPHRRRFPPPSPCRHRTRRRFRPRTVGAVAIPRPRRIGAGSGRAPPGPPPPAVAAAVATAARRRPPRAATAPALPPQPRCC
jgi:hypothetical protein